MRQPARPAHTPRWVSRRWCSRSARVLSIRSVLLIGALLLAACSSPGPAAAPPAGSAPSQRLGVGGVATPADAELTTDDSTDPLEIRESGSEGSPRVYDGQGHTVGTIEIRADWVVVQNFKVQATGQYGFDAKGTHITIQNNDVKGVHASGNGDLNAITFDGDYTSIVNNTAIDFVTGGSGDSHTDGIQTWNDDPGESSSHVLIQGNYFSGPLEDDHSSYIHQCLIGEGAESTDGGGGGTGASEDWLITGNYCVGDMKFDDIDDVTVTGNEFAGIDKRAVVVTSLSTGFKFYSDNKVTGKYGEVGADVLPGSYTGPGPEKPVADSAGTGGAGTGGAGTGVRTLVVGALVVLVLSGLAVLLFRSRVSHR